MTRYYFISYIALLKNGEREYSSAMYRTDGNKMLLEIKEDIKNNRNYDEVVILNLQKVKKKDYKILTGSK